jgi:hypothetical protein
MALEAGFEGVEVEPPGVPESWARTRSVAQRKVITAYSLACRLKVSRAMLRNFGPLWQLRATRRGAA